MAQRTLLLVEDEETILKAIAYALGREGYKIAAATDGPQGLALARQSKPDGVILDLMLPGMDGLEVMRLLRQDSNLPILILTAKDGESDKIVGLELGADDYMTKPFSMRELLARVKAMLRRVELDQSSKTSTLLSVDGLEMDLAGHVSRLHGAPLALRPKEFELLAFLVRQRGIAFSRETLLERVWGYDYAGGTRTVDVHVRWLREKIETDPANPRHLLTVRGVGYKFEA